MTAATAHNLLDTPNLPWGHYVEAPDYAYPVSYNGEWSSISIRKGTSARCAAGTQTVFVIFTRTYALPPR